MDVRSALRQGFLTGIVLVAPLAVTLFVIKLVYGWLVGNLAPVIGLVYPADPSLFVQLIALVLLFGFITALGLAVRHGIGRYALLEFDRFMETIPVIRAIYSSARQASNALLGHREQFERVVLVEWPQSGSHTIGFVTSETPERLTDVLEDSDPRYDVFIPMAPNPMGGFLAIVPESRLVTTELPVSEGLKLVMTTGLGSGEELAIDSTVRNNSK
ncbi:MAG: DUF502 domain-containing protein [Halodesulfurarchaeum sp.]